MVALRAPIRPATDDLTVDEQRAELMKCALSPLYFITRYCRIYHTPTRSWIPFELWPAQIDVLALIVEAQLSIFLKSRQIGITWLALGYATWLMLFDPIAVILIFSRRDDEATYLLGEERLKGMYRRLPDWMQARAVVGDNDHQFELSNGSIARAFPSNAGDSYTATFALIDEADLVPDLGQLLAKVKPTIDAGGKLALVSRADKSKPNSPFKKIYQAAKEGRNDWRCLFLPWYVHPGRDQRWYEKQKADVLTRTGSLDELHEQYPADDVEALAPRSLDKRLLPIWLHSCYVAQDGLEKLPGDAPNANGLLVYRLPESMRKYAIGIDPAEGNPNSDDSSLHVMDKATGEEVAHLSGKFQPSVMAAHADRLARWYNGASILPERNNHGHAVLLWLQDNSRCPILNGWDGKPGWLSNSKGKALLYDGIADALKDSVTTFHSFKTYLQLAGIEGSSLRAPEGEMDDAADSFAITWQATLLHEPDWGYDLA